MLLLFFVSSLNHICYLCDHIMIDKTTLKRLQILYLDPHKTQDPVPLVAKAGSLLGKLMGPLSSQIYKQIYHGVEHYDLQLNGK